MVICDTALDVENLIDTCSLVRGAMIMSVSQIVLEEIALDGLDGITLESLWYRLEKVIPAFAIKLDDKSKPYLWKNVISRLKDVRIFYVILCDC